MELYHSIEELQALEKKIADLSEQEHLCSIVGSIKQIPIKTLVVKNLQGNEVYKCLRCAYYKCTTLVVENHMYKKHRVGGCYCRFRDYVSGNKHCLYYHCKTKHGVNIYGMKLYI